jgi:prepilin peptidase CpaA
MLAYSAVIALVIVSAAVVTDIRSRRIPNWLTFPSVAIGLLYHGITGGLYGLAYSASGLVLGCALFMVFYFLAGMGAGDVKLMGAVGALLGPHGVILSAFFTALAGGVYAIVLLAWYNRLGETASRYRVMVWWLVSTGKIVYVPPPAGKKLPTLCYGVPIAIGTAFVVVKGFA